MPQPTPRALELLDTTPITLDGLPAQLLGRNLDFPSIAVRNRALSVSFSWSAIEGVLEAGGHFRSGDPLPTAALARQMQRLEHALEADGDRAASALIEALPLSKAYLILERHALRSGVIQRYALDLYLHDRRALRHDPTAFGWAQYESGTHLMLSSRDHGLATGLSSLHRDLEAYWYDAGILERVSLETLGERVLNLPPLCDLIVTPCGGSALQMHGASGRTEVRMLEAAVADSLWEERLRAEHADLERDEGVLRAWRATRLLGARAG